MSFPVVQRSPGFISKFFSHSSSKPTTQSNQSAPQANPTTQAVATKHFQKESGVVPSFPSFSPNQTVLLTKDNFDPNHEFGVLNPDGSITRKKVKDLNLPTTKELNDLLGLCEKREQLIKKRDRLIEKEEILSKEVDHHKANLQNLAKQETKLVDSIQQKEEDCEIILKQKANNQAKIDALRQQLIAKKQAAAGATVPSPTISLNSNYRPTPPVRALPARPLINQQKPPVLKDSQGSKIIVEEFSKIFGNQSDIAKLVKFNGSIKYIPEEKRFEITKEGFNQILTILKTNPSIETLDLRLCGKNHPIEWISNLATNLKYTHLNKIILDCFDDRKDFKQKYGVDIKCLYDNITALNNEKNKMINIEFVNKNAETFFKLAKYMRA